MSINLNGTLVPEITNGTGIGTNGSEIYNSGVLTVAGRNGNVTLTNADIGGLGNLATQNAPPAGIVLSNGTTIGLTTLSGGLVYSNGTLSDQWSAGDVTTIGSDLTLSAGTLSLDTTFLENGSLSPRFFQVERQAAQHNQNYLPNSTFLYGYSLWEAQLTGLTINTGNNTTYLSYTGTTTTAQTYSSSNITAAAVTGTGLINLSGWVYNATADGPATISVSCYNSSGTLLGSIAESSVAAGSAWTYVSNNGTPLTGTTYVQVTLGFTGATSGTAIGFSQLKLEDRGIATNWSDEASAQISQSGQTAGVFSSLSVTGAATIDGAISSGAPSSIPVNYLNLAGLSLSSSNLNGYVSLFYSTTTLPSTTGIPVGSWIGIIPQVSSGQSEFTLEVNDTTTETISSTFGDNVTLFSFLYQSGFVIVYAGSGKWVVCDGSYLIEKNLLNETYSPIFSSETVSGSLSVGTISVTGSGTSDISGFLTLGSVTVNGSANIANALTVSNGVTISNGGLSFYGEFIGEPLFAPNLGTTTAGGGAIVNFATDPVSGTWYQNTSGGPLWIQISVDLAAGENAFMYIAEVPTSQAVPADLVQPSTAGYHSVKAIVPTNWYWSITTTGTINPTGFPSYSYRII